MGLVRGRGLPPSAGPRTSPLVRCTHCGAPGQRGRCGYCRTELAQAAPRSTIESYVDAIERPEGLPSNVMAITREGVTVRFLEPLPLQVDPELLTELTS